MQGEWKERFRIHAEDAAVQHRRLAGLIQSLLAAIEESKPPRVVQSAFADLAGYLEIHFSDEEEFMKRGAYPAPLAEKHSRVHDEVLRRVRQVWTDFETGGYLDLNLPSKLTEWLQKEEAEEDKRYLDYFRAQAGV